MKHYFTLLCCALFAAFASAQTFTFSSTDSQTIDGVTVTLDKASGASAPAYYETNGLRLYANNTITVSGANLTSIQLSCAKQGSKPYATLSANCGTLVSGGESASSDAPVIDSWTGSASSVTFTLGASGQRLLLQIVVNNAGGTPTDTIIPGPTDTTSTPAVTLDPNYVYTEPTTITIGAESASHAAYTFVQNNILVSCSQGAITDSYFSCYAGQTITFTASKPITALAANAYLKKDFEATASVGEIEYLDAAEDTIVGNPALIVSNIAANTITLTCVKQIRFYSIDFYFGEDPELELDETAGGYSYEWEPDEATTLNFTMSDLSCQDLSSNLGYACSYLAFSSDEADIYLVAFVHSVAGTALPVGTYQFSDSYAEGTLQASVGGDDYYDYEGYVATNYEEIEGDWYYDPYYLVSGSLQVEATASGAKMTLNATSAKGSTIRMVYEGIPEIISDEPIDDALGNTPSESTANKILLNGHVFILSGDHTFTPAGQKLR